MSERFRLAMDHYLAAAADPCNDSVPDAVAGPSAMARCTYRAGHAGTEHHDERTGVRWQRATLTCAPAGTLTVATVDIAGIAPGTVPAPLCRAWDVDGHPLNPSRAPCMLPAGHTGSHRCAYRNGETTYVSLPPDGVLPAVTVERDAVKRLLRDRAATHLYVANDPHHEPHVQALAAGIARELAAIVAMFCEGAHHDRTVPK